MVLSTEYNILIKALRQKTGDGATKLTAEFRNKTRTLSGVSYHTRKIDAADSVEKRKRQGSGTERIRGAQEKTVNQLDAMPTDAGIPLFSCSTVRLINVRAL